MCVCVRVRACVRACVRRHNISYDNKYVCMHTVSSDQFQTSSTAFVPFKQLMGKEERCTAQHNHASVQLHTSAHHAQASGTTCVTGTLPKTLHSVLTSSSPCSPRITCRSGCHGIPVSGMLHLQCACIPLTL